MATGRDAADVAITTSFGATNLTYFYVDSWEVDAEGNRIPLPEGGTASQSPSHRLCRHKPTPAKPVLFKRKQRPRKAATPLKKVT